jgi:hypothetical protein
MGQEAREGLSVLYVLLDEWLWRRDLLRLLGADDPGRLDTILARPAGGGDRAVRVAGLGGEVVIAGGH